MAKKKYTDLREGRVTLPLLRLRDKLNPKEHTRLKALLGQELASPLEEKWLMEQLESSQALTETLREARLYTEKALGALKSQFLPSQERRSLEALAIGLQERMH